MSEKQIPADIKKKMYDCMARAEASRVEGECGHEAAVRYANGTKEYKKYMKAMKKASRKYDDKIAELQQQAASLINASEKLEQAQSFKSDARAIDHVGDNTYQRFAEQQEEKYQRIIDSAKSSGSKEYQAFQSYNNLVAQKDAEIADEKEAYEKIVRRYDPDGYKHQMQYKRLMDELESSKQRLKDNPDDKLAEMQVAIAGTGIYRMSEGSLTDRYDSFDWFDYMRYTRSVRYIEDELKRDGYSDDDIKQARDEVAAVVGNISNNVLNGNLPVEVLQNQIKQYETKDGDTAFAICVANREGDATATVNTAWGDTYTAENGDYIVSNSPDFTDATVEKSHQFAGKYSEANNADAFDTALEKASHAPAPTAAPSANSNQSKSFIENLIGSIKNRNDDGVSDMDGRSERDKKSDDSQYETFKDKDGNTCRRNRTTGETTVWVEGYDRMRHGKVEHVKSYWKVISPRG